MMRGILVIPVQVFYPVSLIIPMIVTMMLFTNPELVEALVLGSFVLGGAIFALGFITYVGGIHDDEDKEAGVRLMVAGVLIGLSVISCITISFIIVFWMFLMFLAGGGR